MKLSTGNPTVQILYLTPEGTIGRKSQSWQRPATKEALHEWMIEYFERLADGYQPEGFDVPPRPHCARVFVDGSLVAEWISSRARPAAESRVTATETSTSGGARATASTQDDNLKPSAGLRPVYPQADASTGSVDTTADDGVMSGQGWPVT